METPADKTLFDLKAGLRTEDPALNAAPGSTSDEENFHILIDGSRKRRRGLKLETGGETYSLPESLGANDVVKEGRWDNAGGDPANDFVVLQVGKYLHFYNETNRILSPNKRTEVIDLSQYAVAGHAADVGTSPVDMASGNSVFLVASKYIEPIYLEFDGTDITPTLVDLRQRDFGRPDVGYSWAYRPTTLSDAHEYNLRNSGWKPEDITQYQTDESEYPALNMLWYLGYVRQVDGTTYINEDGVKTWNTNKLAAEPFGNAPAPNGSLFLDPFDTREAQGVRDSEFAISTWTVADTGVNPWVITVTTESVHGLTPSDPVEIAGNSFVVTAEDADPTIGIEFTINRSLNGEYTVQSVPNTDEFTINYTFDENFVSFDNQYKQKGTALTGSALTNPNGYSTDERPRVCGWYAGRAWFGGVQNQNLADHIFFSRLVFEGNEYGDCYQVNDPTSELYNELLADDGGVIVIPDMGTLMGAHEQQGGLILFARNGVWEITGQRGVFAADNYNVRKITDVECSSRDGYVQAEGSSFFTGPKGIYEILPDERTATLYARSITEGSIQTAWNDVPFACQQNAKVNYDDANKQLRVLVSVDSENPRDYTKEFIYDLRLKSWFVFTFPSGIYGAFALSVSDRSAQYSKMKYAVIQSDVLSICDIAHSAYTDFDGTEKIPYMSMNEFAEGDFQRYRHAPWLFTYMRKTETGYDEFYQPVNASSLTVQAQWDFSDSATSGKWGTAQQVYRHRRAYTPSGPSDTFADGYGTVVARSKLRGRGRSLKLKLTGEAGKDAHLDGLALQYRVKRSV